MKIEVHPQNPEFHKIKLIVDALEKGHVIIYPNDTVYALGCDIYNKKAIERLCQIKQIPLKKATFSVITDSLSNLSLLSKSIDTPTFRMIKNHIPGPFTFILPASKQIPAFFNNNRENIGIRIPDNKICLDILEAFGKPIVSTTLPIDEYVEDYTDPDIIYEKYKNQVDLMIDGGPGGMEVSTMVDCTHGDWEIIRQGKGNFNR